MKKTNSFTGNGANAYEHSEDHLLEFFSKVGTCFEKKSPFYNNPSNALDLFKNAWYTGRKLECMKLLFWLRDIRGGAGVRSASRSIWNWIAKEDSAWAKSNVKFIPELGRWDDLFALYNTPCEKDALKLWAKAIKEGDGLACKWADRQDRKLRDFMKLSPKAFRKLLVKNTKVVETSMCNREWNGIEYSHVPSVAIGRYNKAFYKNDKDRYDSYRKSLVKVSKDGTVELTGKVNAGAIYPHDLIRTVRADCYKNPSMETKKLVEAQFLSMENFMKDSDARIIPLIDSSGSMFTNISGQIQAVDVAVGLGLYCSDKIGEKNPFYRKVIPFSSSASFVSWEKTLFADACKLASNGYCGSTNIVSALDLILNSAKMFKVSKDQMPNMILIISDMQFDGAVSNGGITPVEGCMQAWEKAGYDRPTIVYWNVNAYGNQPATAHHKNVAMVSGFSTSILRSVLGGAKDFTPLGIMKKTLSAYSPVTPKNKES